MKNLIMLLIVFVLSCGVVSADLINGSFELEEQNGGWASYAVPTSWTRVDLGKDYYGYGTTASIPSVDGDQHVNLKNTLLWQNTGMVMTEGYTYELSAYALTYNGGTQFVLALYGASTADATAREDLLGQGQFSPREESLGFDSTPFVYSYTCDAANAGKYLQAAVYGWGDHSYRADMVELTEIVPEPATMLLMTLGGLVSVLRRRR